MDNINELDVLEVYQAILKMNNVQELADFFDDLCTHREVESFALRLKAAKLLNEGDTYEQVIDKIAISSTTLSRVSRCLHYGKGYKNYLKK